MGEKCIFCTFIQERSGYTHNVYEDARVLAFLDHHPITDGHTLVVLKEHYRDLASVPLGEAKYLGGFVALVARAIKDVFGCEMVYTASLGEEVQHVHYHVIPRRVEDQKGFVHFLTPRTELSDGPELAARIKSALSKLSR